MDRQILQGYVEAVVEAGLFPLVVETPSLSLVRLSPPGEAGTLILYNNFGEGILVIAEGEKILGSSIIPVEAKQELIRTASQIIAHYKDTKVEKLLIGGAALDADLVKSLEKELGTPVERIVEKVEGLTEAQAQEYLVPIALGLKEPAKPSDENTINLLPAPLVMRYEKEKFRLQLWGLTLTITLFVWISFLTATGTYLFLGREANSLREGNVEEQKGVEARATAQAKVKDINQLADRVLKIKAGSVYPEEILEAIDKATPAGMTIAKYKMDLDKGDIRLEGVVVDRLTLIEFKQKLEENSKISSVIIPVSSFEVENNLDFKLSFQYASPSVKNKGK
jgi:hypothetical protein